MNYPDLCNAMEKSGWISHSVACSVGEYGKERLPSSLKRSQTFQAWKAGKKPPRFKNSSAEDAFLVFKDVNGIHPVYVRVNRTQGLVRARNGSNDEFSVGYIVDLQKNIRKKVAARLKK